VKWFGKVTLGKLGSIYCGEMPSATSLLRVGVNPRLRKSARNPSREINIVVGAKRAVPFDNNVLEGLDVWKCVDALYAPKRKIRNRTKIAAKAKASLSHETRRGR
jgi:hypothetical protein